MQEQVETKCQEQIFALEFVSVGETKTDGKRSDGVEENRLTCSVLKVCSNNEWAEQVNLNNDEVDYPWEEEAVLVVETSGDKGIFLVECLIPACWADFQAIAVAQPNAQDPDYQDWFAEFIEAYDALEAMVWLYADRGDETSLGR